MSGNVWMFSDEIDDEDLEFMRVVLLSFAHLERHGVEGREHLRHMKQVQYIKLGKRC